MGMRWLLVVLFGVGAAFQLPQRLGARCAAVRAGGGADAPVSALGRRRAAYAVVAASCAAAAPPVLPAAASAALRAAERETIELFERATRSVVFIDTFVESRGGDLSLAPAEERAGTGSGFAWDGSGHIVTNYHVIRNAVEARVTILDGKNSTKVSRRAELRGVDPDKDVAVRVESHHWFWGIPSNSSNISTAVESNSFPAVSWDRSVFGSP